MAGREREKYVINQLTWRFRDICEIFLSAFDVLITDLRLLRLLYVHVLNHTSTTNNTHGGELLFRKYSTQPSISRAPPTGQYLLLTFSLSATLFFLLEWMPPANQEKGCVAFTVFSFRFAKRVGRTCAFDWLPGKHSALRARRLAADAEGAIRDEKQLLLTSNPVEIMQVS